MKAIEQSFKKGRDILVLDTEKGEPPGNAGPSGAEAPGGTATSGAAASPSGAGSKSDSTPIPSKVW